MAVLPPPGLLQAVRRLHEGGVIAYPTESVYGLGCDPGNAPAVRRLLAIKRRPAAKGLILIAAQLEQLHPFIRTPDPKQRQRLEAGWPGPLTWLVPARSSAPVWLTGHHDTLAVRVTAHPVAAALCRAFGGPIISTSANLSGRPPALDGRRARLTLGRWLDGVMPGRAGGGRPTEIRDLRSGRVLRAG